MLSTAHAQFQLCFLSLFGHGRAYAFPCDPKGRVDMDQLSDGMRNNYLFARAMVGRELQVPEIRMAS